MKNDGGPAYPLQLENRDQYEGSNDGMSLRDYFAGQALATLLVEVNKTLMEEGVNIEIGAWAYRIADAMLAAREQS